MTAESPAFLAFSLAVVLIFSLSSHRLWKLGVLLAASILFIFLLTPRPAAAIPIFCFVLFGYGCLRLVQDGQRRLYPWIVGAIILLFLWLKRYAFLPSQTLLPFAYVTVGLSYILFRLLHMVIDSHNGVLEGRISPASYLAYLLNFTTFVSGPIQRYPDFVKCLETRDFRQLDPVNVGRAVERVVRGVFKMRVLAFLFSALHDRAIQTVLHGAVGTPERALQGALVFSSYTFFLYCNFSGFIDVAIGIAALLGIILPENFDRPFSSESFIEFWSRWHITLSAWLKDYVYLPLLSALMRRYPQRSIEPYLGVAAYFLTFFLVGVWHGQNSEFFFFGLLQGGGVALNKLYQVFAARIFGRNAFRKFSTDPIWCAAGRGLTFTWFTFTLAWFWSDWGQIEALFAAMGRADTSLAWGGMFAVSAALLAVWEFTYRWLLRPRSASLRIVDSRYSRTAVSTALVVAIVTMAALLNQPVPEIVYGKF